MSAIALIILAGSFVSGIDQDTFQESRHVYWADSTVQDPMRNISSLVASWDLSFNPTGIKTDKSDRKGFDRIPVHNITECNAYADKLMYALKTDPETSSQAIYNEARCIYIPDGYSLDDFNDVYRTNDDGKTFYHDDPFALKKIPDPQELAQEQLKKDHPDCLHETAGYPLDSKSDNLIEAEGSVDLKCFFNKESDGRYHASQCDITKVTLDKHYKKKLEKLYKQEFSESALDFMSKRCILNPPEELAADGKGLAHIEYSQED